MIRRAPCVVAGLVLAGAPAAAQPREASDANVLDAVRLCQSATGDAGVDIAAVTRAGWEPATASDGGQAVALPLPIYGHADSSAMLMLPPGEPICVVTARVRGDDGLARIRAALDGLYPGNALATDDPAEPMWAAGGHIISLAQTGRRDRPAVRVAVMKIRETSE